MWRSKGTGPRWPGRNETDGREVEVVVRPAEACRNRVFFRLAMRSGAGYGCAGQAPRTHPMNASESSGIPLGGDLRPNAAAWFGFGLIALVLIYFFGFHHAYPTSQGKSLAHWCWLAWNAKNDTLHGKAIPFAFALMCWLGWKKARHEPIRPALWGMVPLLAGVGLYLISARALQPRLALFGLPFVILGGLLFCAGPKFTRHFVFASFFWYFAIPVPGIQQATALLQVVVTKLCFQAGLLMGMPIMCEGNTISATSGTSWGFDIAEGCSGIRSLMALTMIAAIYANYTQKTLWKKAFLFACALPLALVGNFGRVFTILLLAHFGFEKFAARTYHDWAGLLIFFPIALTGLFVIDRLINPRPKRRLKRTVRNDGGGDAKPAGSAAV